MFTLFRCGSTWRLEHTPFYFCNPATPFNCWPPVSTRPETKYQKETESVVVSGPAEGGRLIIEGAGCDDNGTTLLYPPENMLLVLTILPVVNNTSNITNVPMLHLPTCENASANIPLHGWLTDWLTVLSLANWIWWCDEDGDALMAISIDDNDYDDCKGRSRCEPSDRAQSAPPQISADYKVPL